MAGYGPSLGGMRIIGGLWLFAGLLEYLRHFSPGRHPSIEGFAGSALGALCGVLVIAFLWRRPSAQSWWAAARAVGDSKLVLARSGAILTKNTQSDITLMN
jgi:hypothetical protein